MVLDALTKPYFRLLFCTCFTPKIKERRGNVIIRNPLQRYKNNLEYANFEAQKVNFLDKKCAFSCIFQIFVVPLQAQRFKMSSHDE